MQPMSLARLGFCNQRPPRHISSDMTSRGGGGEKKNERTACWERDVLMTSTPGVIPAERDAQHRTCTWADIVNMRRADDAANALQQPEPQVSKQCLGGAAVRRRTSDRKVAGSTPGRGAIKSTRSTQPSIPPG